MNGKLVQSLINLFPYQHQDMMVKCVFIIGFDKLIKKGFIASGSPKIHEITEYANKVQSYGRLNQVQEPCDIRHELDLLKDEIGKLTQQIQYNNSIIQRQTQRSHDRLIQNLSPLYDDRKRSASVGFKQQHQMLQKKPREITPKITETIPQTVNQIHITISKHHLDDTEIKSVMRDNQAREKPPKPNKTLQDVQTKKIDYYQHIETEEAPVFEDSDRNHVNYIPQVLQYSQLQQSQISQQQYQQLQQSQVSSQSNAKQSDQQSHNTHNTNQTFAQPQSSQKQLISTTKQGQQRSPNRSPKFKYQSKQQSKRNLETVQEESSQSQLKHMSSHSASSKGRGSHRQPKTQQNTQAVSKIKALLDQDKKIYKQHLMDIASERGSFINSSDKLKRMSDDKQEEIQRQQQNSDLNNSINRRTFSNYKQEISPQIDYEPRIMQQAQYNQLQGSMSMTNSNRTSGFVNNPPMQDNILIYSKYKQQVLDQYSPKVKYQYRPSSVGKQQESDFKRSEDFNRSSVSSTFSMFNPNEELKTFFQNDFLERKRYIPCSDMTKQSSLSSSQDHNQHQSKYITASQIEEQQNASKNIFSPQYHNDKSNVFNNNRLSVTRILNNSQI